MSTPNNAFVICCNDSVQHVVIGHDDSKAIQIMNELAKADFEKNLDYHLEQHRQFGLKANTAYATYLRRMHWHINIVGVTI